MNRSPCVCIFEDGSAPAQECSYHSKQTNEILRLLSEEKHLSTCVDMLQAEIAGYEEYQQELIVEGKFWKDVAHHIAHQYSKPERTALKIIDDAGDYVAAKRRDIIKTPQDSEFEGR